MRGIALFLLFCLLLPATSHLSRAADPPATAPTQPATSPTTRPVDPAVAALLKSLSSGDWRLQKKAQDALIKMGEDVRPALQDFVQAATDIDATTRAQAALAQIDENRVSGPSYITLHVKDADPKAVAAEISRQAFCDLKPFPDTLFDDKSLPRVALDIDHLSFWNAMRLFTDQSGLELRPYNEGRRLMRGNDLTGGVSVIQGPFLFVAQQVMRTQMIVLGPHAQNRSDFMVSVAAYAEPKLIVLGNASSLQVEQAIDDAGNSLVPPANELRSFFGGSNGNWNMAVRLHWPAKPGKRIKRLVASTAFTIQTRSEKLQIDNLQNAKTQTYTIGGANVVFRGCAKAGDAWELKLAISNNTPLLQQMLQTQMQVLDDQGRPLNRRMTSGQGDGATTTYTIQYASARMPGVSMVGDPVRLLWEVPTESKSIPVTFEFDDLPMPE